MHKGTASCELCAENDRVTEFDGEFELKGRQIIGPLALALIAHHRKPETISHRIFTLKSDIGYGQIAEMESLVTISGRFTLY